MGLITKEEFELAENIRKQAELTRLQNIERAAQEYIMYPTEKNESRLKDALYPKEKGRRGEWHNWPGK